MNVHRHSISFPPSVIALAITAVFSIRFIFLLPFSSSVRQGNYETAVSKIGFLIYAREDLTFPLGLIKSLTAPFQDANVGNMGAIPLFAVFFKMLATVFPYFQTFDYFVLLEMLACFFTAFFAIHLMKKLGVSDIPYQVAAAGLTGLSFLILIRSEWIQPFCVLSFPVIAAFFLLISGALVRRSWRAGSDIAIVFLFPVSILLDAYIFAALAFASAFLIMWEIYEGFVRGLRVSLHRATRLSVCLIIGVLLAIGALWAIGMFPVPMVDIHFTSYDFGLGGRYHVADLLSPVVPVHELSLLGTLLFPLTTADLAAGQYEGIAYIGTATIFLGLMVFILKLLLHWGKHSQWKTFRLNPRERQRPKLWSPWAKIGFSSLFVFILSLGYQLHIGGRPFPDFFGMPAAWAADLVPPLYQFRAPGRWSAVLSIFLIITTIKLFHKTINDRRWRSTQFGKTQIKRLGYGILFISLLVHVTDISPLIRPVASQPSEPLEGVFTHEQISLLQTLGRSRPTVFFAPSVHAAGTWTKQAFSAAYYMETRSNLYNVARKVPEHYAKIRSDLNQIINGNWDSLNREYGNNIIIALPHDHAEPLRAQKIDRYEELSVGPISFWKLKSV